ncbi:hypothetical protein SETIT_8G199400v2 [Setaria italica]|uniref:Uncharacterized protein n=1 Tax=Setaria italica TaxID=4555 RepID=A0A368S9T6_SETIT|nr:hypothetical protein SETIT_8G199400v2 [Setaria italica]
MLSMLPGRRTPKDNSRSSWPCKRHPQPRHRTGSVCSAHHSWLQSEEDRWPWPQDFRRMVDAILVMRDPPRSKGMDGALRTTRGRSKRTGYANARRGRREGEARGRAVALHGVDDARVQRGAARLDGAVRQRKGKQ